MKKLMMKVLNRQKKKQKELESKEKEALAKEKAANAMSGEIGSSSKIV